MFTMLKIILSASLIAGSHGFAKSLKATGASRVPGFLESRFGQPSQKAADEQNGMSEALPFLPRPATLNAINLPGDAGFDPLNLAKDEDRLYFYREAELKHARIAMLAAIGWPVSELVGLNLDGPFKILMQNYGKAPSVLNGGLGLVSPGFWLAVLAFTSAVEAVSFRISDQAADVGRRAYPQDFGFDPRDLYPSDKRGRRKFQDAELANGRLAMIAITLFAVQEAATNLSVIWGSPQFFAQ